MDKDKGVKNGARNDKQHFIDGLATEAKEATGWQLARITKRLKGDSGGSQDQPVKDKFGRLISDEKKYHDGKSTLGAS